MLAPEEYGLEEQFKISARATGDTGETRRINRLQADNRRRVYPNNPEKKSGDVPLIPRLFQGFSPVPKGSPQRRSTAGGRNQTLDTEYTGKRESGHGFLRPDRRARRRNPCPFSRLHTDNRGRIRVRSQRHQCPSEILVKRAGIHR